MIELEDHRSDEEFLRNVLKGMSPVSVLSSVAVDLTRLPDRSPKHRAWKNIHLSFISGYPSGEKDALINAQADARQAMLERNPEFRAALKRLTRTGVKPEWDYTSEYSYAARLLRLVVPEKALSRLEGLAADDAGIRDPEDRRRAAELFRRWLLQNHHPEWEQYRQRWPFVEQSPYRFPCV